MPIISRRTRKILKVLLILFVLLFLASLVSLYSYGRFARRALGEPSHAIPPDRIESTLDRFIDPLTRANPGKTGMTLFADNLDAFAVRALTAREATRSLDLQYYIWHEDLTGHMLGYELLKAAERGVRVRLLLDDLNSHSRDTVLVALEEHPNIEVRMFNPSRGSDGSFRRGMELVLRFVSTNRRMHNKAWIADGRIAIVGGRNIGNEYFDASDRMNFLDLDLGLVGPAVAQASEMFDAYWNSKAVIPLSALVQPTENARQKLLDEGRLETYTEQAKPYRERLQSSETIQALLRGNRPAFWTDEARILADPPEKAFGRGAGEWLIHAMIPTMENAQRELRIISPYFVPGELGTAKLQALKQRIPSVDILTNSLEATDVVAVHGGYARYRRDLLEAGVSLFELKPFGPPEGGLFGSSGASLHTKAFMVDGEWGFVGSFNFDLRSAELNTEMGVLFRAPELVDELIAAYEDRIVIGSYRLALEDDKLRWYDYAETPPKVWKREPEAGLWRRMVAKIVSWLPIESQL